MGGGRGSCSSLGCALFLFIVFAAGFLVYLFMLRGGDHTVEDILSAVDAAAGDTDATTAPPAPPEGPQPGQRLRVTRALKLVQGDGTAAPDPDRRIRFVNPGGTLRVLEAPSTGARHGYRVKAWDPRGEAMGEGYLAAADLRGRTADADAEAPTAAATPADGRVTTLIGTLEPAPGGGIRFTVRPPAHAEDAPARAYVLEDAAGRAAAVVAGVSGPAEAVVIGQAFDREDPPRLVVRSAHALPKDD